MPLTLPDLKQTWMFEIYFIKYHQHKIPQKFFQWTGDGGWVAPYRGTDRQNTTKLTVDLYKLAKTNTKDKDKYENKQRKISKSLLNMRHMCKVLGQFSGCCSPCTRILAEPINIILLWALQREETKRLLHHTSQIPSALCDSVRQGTGCPNGKPYPAI